ncbi:carbonic anhydrase [Hyphomicrobium sulfonivorans]|uniref:carbonic anhydrase n=1 Tax=Hyphomicrobium sulfonivorans TaxID=121290 RepID=UPI001570C667|nr:carbonic anhydrase family protein [Hyphomicrobium sulfonivorans]MBI1650496.1 carbonic anhydrase family protein [Hyphomicrobium sulfonivorans]NSL72145.1 carbonate dehydratase [Hyphomicrobium sulfonivorans]
MQLSFNFRSVTPLALAAFAALAPVGTLSAEDHAHWSYEGHGGPTHWGELSHEFAACAKGAQQSPIDIKTAEPSSAHAPTVNWKPFVPGVVNNGHTIQANAAGDQTTTLGDETFKLVQMHFHHDSEHTFDGHHTPLEAHFVNRSANGKLLVLGVMINEGAANSEIEKVWQVMPKAEGEANAREAIDFAQLIPAGGKFYRYAGSLTTPPCSEIVEWVVYADPIEASAEQIKAFAALYPHNNRPVQALGDRTVVLGR